MKSGPESNRIGEIVGGKYRVVRLLASGGMGVVYEAQHAVVRRRFAIKFLRRDLAERRDILGRFQREAAAAGALENDNVTAAVDFGISDDGTPFIVMEYLVGESLAALLEREGRLPVHRAADLVAQACRGVDAAHAAGIVHRDLKPQNLFVARRDDGTDLVKVLDFGVAKLQAIDEATAATGTGTILGTAAYMSPEQARGEKSIDRRTDIYALGAILYELLSQRKPHPGDSQNAILHHIATHPAVPLDTVGPDLPPELVAIVARALAFEAAARPGSAGALAQELAAFARREVWSPQPETSAPTRAAFASTSPAAPDWDRPIPGVESPGGTPRARPPGPARRRAARGARVTLAVGLAATASIGVRIALKTRSVTPRSDASTARALDETTKFFVPPPAPPATQQIARLAAARALEEASLLTALTATPRAVYFTEGTPEEVEAAVQKVVVRAGGAGEVPVLVVNNLPYRDCAQYSAGGARDAAAYRAWFDGFVRGIGKERAVVILEPDSLGIIPNNTSLDGSLDWCHPTVTNSEGKTVAAPGATADERYALLAAAIDRLVSGAPNALIYLDGTHGGWVPVSEIAYRLSKAGVDRTRGFAVNVANFQPTAESVKYGTWISKCLLYAAHGGGAPARFKECRGQYAAGKDGARDWTAPEKWYADNVDRAPWASSAGTRAAHFVVDTSRNGRGTLDVAVFARAPFNQPPEVIQKLKVGDWCNAPSAGAGPRPTARTGEPLADAFLWIKTPGHSDGSCDVAGSTRAWDYARFNPWKISGEPQRHFDPLWGMVDPPAGEWFPEAAVELARNADPPLVDGARPTATEERPPRRPKIPTSLPPTFDPANPYR
jgi:endoglucanase